MWKLDHKESWAPKNWSFQIVVLEKTLESSLDFKEIKSVHFSQSVVSDSFQPCGLQHARPPCPSPTPGVHSSSCPLSWWCHPAISSSVVPFSSCFQFFPAPESFSNELALCIKWPKYWSFSISTSDEYSGLISFRIDRFDLIAVQGTLKSLRQHHTLKASILRNWWERW